MKRRSFIKGVAGLVAASVLPTAGLEGLKGLEAWEVPSVPVKKDIYIRILDATGPIPKSRLTMNRWRVLGGDDLENEA